MKKRINIKHILVNSLTVFLVVFCVLLIGYHACLENIVVSGNSMSPTLVDLEYGVMNTTDLKKNSIKRFDIIIFERKADPSSSLIKRVIGLPGEKIRIERTTGELRINDKVVAQKFLKNYPDLLKGTCKSSSLVACDKDFIVPEKEYYVLGDNRLGSLDSEHGLGTVEYQKIHGVLFAIQGTCKAIEKDKDGYDICTGKKGKLWRFY